MLDWTRVANTGVDVCHIISIAGRSDRDHCEALVRMLTNKASSGRSTESMSKSSLQNSLIQ